MVLQRVDSAFAALSHSLAQHGNVYVYTHSLSKPYEEPDTFVLMGFRDIVYAHPLEIHSFVQERLKPDVVLVPSSHYRDLYHDLFDEYSQLDPRTTNLPPFVLDECAKARGAAELSSAWTLELLLANNVTWKPNDAACLEYSDVWHYLQNLRTGELLLKGENI